jgi:beta-glucosidase/6-phospho-beta-glucosidase/beta-galactosidase
MHTLQPVITLWHWDTPQALEDAYGSWLNEKIQDDFSAYARVCYEVGMWICLRIFAACVTSY